MKLHLLNRPVMADKKLYEEAIGFLSDEFKKITGVKGFFRFGNITVPGISDLDLLLVFEDKMKCDRTGFENLPDKYSYLFTHGIMAVSESDFHRNNYYTLWSEHNPVFDNGISESPLGYRTSEINNFLKIQTALEFIVANYIDLKVQLEYKVIKLRSFLQHMKGILYDLEFLNIKESEIHSLLYELKDMMVHWFKKTPDDQHIINWIEKFNNSYDKFVIELFSSHTLYLPELQEYRIARNMILEDGDLPSYNRKGYIIPMMYVEILKQRYIKLQNRLNKFKFHFPLTNIPSHPVLEERFRFLQEMKQYNRNYLPGFMTITTSITSKMI